MKTIIIGYKFIKSDMTSINDDSGKWAKRIWKKHKGPLELCSYSFLACRSPLQSLEYINGSRWFIVEARGNIITGHNKFAASEMRLIRELPLKKIAVEFAISCAERCLRQYEETYTEYYQPREAIEAARRWLANPTEKNRLLAESAAWPARSARYAAESVSCSARSAARSARFAAMYARYAARATARATAWATTDSAADSAADSAERKWQDKIFKKIIKKYTMKKEGVKK